jgi:hypothetical protein
MPDKKEKKTAVAILSDTQIALKGLFFQAVTDVEIKEFIEKYEGLEISGKGKERTESYDKIKDAHIHIKKIYADIEKERKGYASTITKFGKQVKGTSDRLKEALEPLGAELKKKRDAEDKIKAEKKEEKDRIEKERVEAIKKEIAVFEGFCTEVLGNINVDSETIRKALVHVENYSTEEETFQEYAPEITMKKESSLKLIQGMIDKKVEQEKEAADLKAEKARQAAVEEKQKAENKRLEEKAKKDAAKLKKEQDKIKADQKTESDKLAKDKKEFEDKKAEQAEKVRLEDERIQKEKDDIEAEKKRVKKEADDKKQADIKEEEDKKKAEKERLAKIESDKKAAKEKEDLEIKRKEKEELLRPDKEKLLNLVKSFKFEYIELKNKEAVDLLNNFNNALEIFLQDYETKINEEL